MAYKPLNPNSQATMANSEPVVIASDQSAIPASQSGTWNVTNVSGTVSLPTGASTSANQTTIIGHLDGVEGLLTTIDTDTSNISTKIDTLAGAVAGTEMQVDVLTLPNVTIGSAIPAGTNNIGDVDVASIAAGTNYIGKVRLTDGTTDTDVRDLANSNALNVSIVDGSGDQITSFGGGTQYTEADTDASITGTAIMFESNTGTNAISVVSNSAPLPVSDAGGSITVDGTVAATQSGTWNVTNISGTVSLPTGASTLAEQQTQTTALQLIDDIVYTDDTSTHATGTSKGALIMAAAAPTDTAVSANDIGAVGMTVNREMYVSLTTALPAGTNNIGDVDVLTLPVAFNTGTASATTVRTITASDSPEVTSLAVMEDWDNAASDGASVSGDVAHDTPDAGEPVKVGFKAYELDGTAPQGAVAEADRVNGISDLVGRQYVATEHPRFWHVAADYGSAQTNTSIKAAPGVGFAIYITDIMISNGAIAGNITLLDGSGGALLFEIYPAVNGGVALNLKNPIKLSDNTALVITSTTVTTHAVFVSGFID